MASEQSQTLMKDFQPWIPWFQNPVLHQKCIGLFGFPGQDSFAFYSNLESCPEIAERWIVHPFHTGGGLPGFSIPIQEKITLNAENPTGFGPLIQGWRSQFNYHQTTKIDFLKGIQSIQKELENKEGKVVISIRQPVSIGLFNPLQTFWTLRSRYPQALVWFLSCPIFGTWIGASPEVLIQQNDSIIESWSLAGTRHNSEPNWTSKERSEQSMVTQYLKQAFLDFGLKPKLQPEPEEMEMGNLKHLRTRVTADSLNCLPKEEIARLAAQIHPTPAVGVFPAENVFERVLALENQPRSYYSGYVGFQQSNKTQFYVNLRCAEIQGNTATLFAGAGITKNSDPESEWIEVQRKAELIRSCLPLYD
jgi:isochorismate synthase